MRKLGDRVDSVDALFRELPRWESEFWRRHYNVRTVIKAWYDYVVGELGYGISQSEEALGRKVWTMFLDRMSMTGWMVCGGREDAVSQSHAVLDIFVKVVEDVVYGELPMVKPVVERDRPMDYPVSDSFEDMIRPLPTEDLREHRRSSHSGVSSRSRHDRYDKPVHQTIPTSPRRSESVIPHRVQGLEEELRPGINISFKPTGNVKPESNDEKTRKKGRRDRREYDDEEEDDREDEW